jgi:hypothetical protein
MKYIVILLLIAFVSNAQITKTIKPYALATKYNFDFRYLHNNQTIQSQY